MKRVSLEHLASEYGAEDYGELCRAVYAAVGEGRIKPVKASGTNGKKPMLYREYWVAEQGKDYRALEEELSYGIIPQISTDYYLRHLPEYEKDRPFVLQLNAYLKAHGDAPLEPASVNERSYEIWKREKFLKREQGRKILKRCGIAPAALCCYETSEPLAYYAHRRDTPQELLILENKDTFYSMRRHLLSGGGAIFGIRFGTLIYGAGKGILRSFRDFGLCAEPYMTHPENAIYYFGDLDYEGIAIYERLAELFAAWHEVLPFVPAYEAMLEKERDAMAARELLPKMKDGQRERLTGRFYSYFGEEPVRQMREILSRGYYIPQECLNAGDF